MVRKSLLVAVLLATAAPLAAQQVPVEWTSRRPDGQAPVGVVDGQMLARGQVLFGYRFLQADSKGLWLDSDSLTLDQSLQEYSVVPHSLVNQTHEVTLAFAPTSTLTLVGHMTYSQREREEWFLYNGTLYYHQTQTKGLGDLQVSALYSVFNQGAVRAHIHLGALLPTGAYHPTAVTALSGTAKGPLPYEMRAGSGTYAVVPGMTMLAQNDFGSVGAQVLGTFYIGTNDRDFAPGNIYDFNAWAAYKLNAYFSISARAHYRRWDAIKGADPSVSSYIGQDPGYNGYNAKGHSFEIPFGLNIYMPEGMHLGGNRLSIEFVRTASQFYQGPHLGADWALVMGWQTVF
jgi:hypothetical protein